MFKSKKSAKQILILGNGFDLACDLESRYKNFFEEYYKDALEQEQQDNKEILEDLAEGGTGNKALENSIYLKDYCNANNFWINYFFNCKKYGKNEIKWADIEKAIEDVLITVLENYDNLCQFNKNFLDENDNLISTIIKTKWKKMGYRIMTYEQFYENYKSNSSLGGQDKDGKMKYTPNNIEFSKIGMDNSKIVQSVSLSKFLNWLMEDLLIFENAFAKYLREEIEKNVHYKEKANKLLKKLLNVCVDNYKININQILSFNYTQPFDLKHRKDTLINVHGSLCKNNIIFGIDGHNSKYELLNQFTKTYRLCMNDTAIFKFDNDIKIIKFFGHSLAKADYSYFHTIFDKINLYDGDVKLVFLYSVYGEGKIKDFKNDVVMDVFKLINKYGETLDSKEHGKNMIHKLLLEGRLKVILI